jgi:hypothetical protein
MSLGQGKYHKKDKLRSKNTSYFFAYTLIVSYNSACACVSIIDDRPLIPTFALELFELLQNLSEFVLILAL